MNHYIKKCKECQTVMGQCRCPAENKFVEWAVCEKCSQKTKVSNINEVVERVKARVAVDGRAWIPTDMVGNYVDCASDDIRTLLAAYESAMRERDEARVIAVSIAVQERDRARTALRRVREAVAALDGGTIHANGHQFPAPEAVNRSAVLALLDREASDAA